MDGINEPGEKVLADSGNSASDFDVFITRSLFGAPHSFFDSAGNEVKSGSALHYLGLAFVVRQDEGWRVVRRIVAPPALPVGVWPRTAHRTEHVAAEDESAEIIHGTPRELVVDSCRTALLALHRTKHSSGKKPLEKLGATLSERIVQALFWAGAEPIDRNAKSSDANFWHGGKSSSLMLSLPLWSFEI
jgi:hypothetical protein